MSLISYIPEGRVHLVDDVAVHFISKFFSTTLDVNSILKCISSSSFYSTLLNSSIISFLRVSRSDKLKFLSSIFLSFPHFLFSSTCSLLSFWDLRSNKFGNLWIVSAPLLQVQLPGVVMEKLLFSLVVLKTELVASKEVIAINHFSYSTKFIGC